MPQSQNGYFSFIGDYICHGWNYLSLFATYYWDFQEFWDSLKKYELKYVKTGFVSIIEDISEKEKNQKLIF